MLKEIDQRRVAIRKIVAELPSIVKPEYNYFSGEFYPVSEWSPRAVALANLIRLKIRKIEDPYIQEEARGILRDGLREIRQRRAKGLKDEEIIYCFKAGIASISQRLAEPTAFKDYEQYKHNFVSFEQMKKEYPDRLEITEFKINGVDVRRVRVYDNNKNLLGYYDIPINPRIRLKGGDARAIGKRYFRESDDLLFSEYPMSDRDGIILGNNPEDYRVALALGMSEDGIEIVFNDNFGEYCAGRDVEPNQVYLDFEGLHYSDDAKRSFETGIFTVSGREVATKALYGSDVFPLKVEGEVIYLIKPRAGARIIKFIAEEKMKGAWFMLENGKHFDFRLYALLLINKWRSKPPDVQPLYAQRLYYIMREMGQTEKSGRVDRNIMELLESAHSKFPFFKFDTGLSETDVVEWLLRKLGKQIDREFALKYSLTSGFIIDTTREALEMKKLISLDGFEFNPDEAREYISWLPDFKRRCNTIADSLPPLSNYERMFFGLADMDDEDNNGNEIIFATTKR